MSKKAKILIGVPLCIIVILLAVVWILWSGEIRTILTIRQVGDNPYLYYMEYKASYDLDEVIAKDIDENAELLDYIVARIGKGLPIKVKSSQVADENGEVQTLNCTSFQARNCKGGFLYGRNYDYFANPTLITVSRPAKGYASIAASDMSHFGYSLDELPTSFKKKLLCLAAIYAPVDGMNEKGLCTSIMAIPHQPSQQNTPKHDVGTSVIMRLWLDRCATVGEALQLLDSLDVRHDASVGSGYHYMVADAAGNCVVVEFDKDDGWKTLTVSKQPEKNYMLVTNHLLSPKYYTTEPDPAVGNPNSRSWWRYATASEYLDAHDGVLSVDQALECLGLVHWDHLDLPNGKVEVTQYGNVYDQKRLTLRIRPWNQYDKYYDFEL